jgi:hypothetical protein
MYKHIEFSADLPYYLRETVGELAPAASRIHTVCGFGNLPTILGQSVCKILNYVKLLLGTVVT